MPAGHLRPAALLPAHHRLPTYLGQRLYTKVPTHFSIQSIIDLFELSTVENAYLDCLSGW
jgi:hypothetical protein